MTKEPTPRKKAWKPKVKTGCITCRFRRIKCDEGKPHCKRCVSTGRKCDGYTVVSSGGSKAASNPITIGPRLWVGTLEEQQNFHFFQQHTATDFFGVFGSLNWMHDILLASNVEPSLRHAIIALGALHRRFLSGTLPLAQQTDDADMRFALRQFNESIRHLLEKPSPLENGVRSSRPSTSKPPLMQPRTALAACVLYTCFASLQGRQKEALSHVRFGLKILSDVEVNPPSPSAAASPIPVGLLRAIFTGLDSQARVMLSDDDVLSWTSSPAFAVVDEPSLLSHFATFRDANTAVESLFNALVTYLRCPDNLLVASKALMSLQSLPEDGLLQASYQLFLDRFALADIALDRLIRHSPPRDHKEKKMLLQIQLNRVMAQIIIEFTRIYFAEKVALEMQWDEMDPLFEKALGYAAELLGCPKDKLDRLANTIPPVCTPQKTETGTAVLQSLQEIAHPPSVLTSQYRFPHAVAPAPSKNTHFPTQQLPEDDMTAFIDPALLSVEWEEPQPSLPYAEQAADIYGNPFAPTSTSSSSPPPYTTYPASTSTSTSASNFQSSSSSSSLSSLSSFSSTFHQQGHFPTTTTTTHSHSHSHPHPHSNPQFTTNPYQPHPHPHPHPNSRPPPTFPPSSSSSSTTTSTSPSTPLLLFPPTSQGTPLPTFTCTSHVVQPLWFCATRSRNPSVRRRALALLLHFPRREALWDSVLAARIAWEWMAVEEGLAWEGKRAREREREREKEREREGRVGSIGSVASMASMMSSMGGSVGGWGWDGEREEEKEGGFGGAGEGGGGAQGLVASDIEMDMRLKTVDIIHEGSTIGMGVGMGMGGSGGGNGSLRLVLRTIGQRREGKRGYERVISW